MKRVLVIDGGGMKGIIPAFVVEAIESKEGRSCYNIFDLICGTSTGSVIGGVLAAGVHGDIIRKLYCETVPKLFTPRNRFNPLTWNKPEKYDREPFIDEIDRRVNCCKFSECKTLFLTTAFNLCSNRTHFLHSDDPTENYYGLSSVISWSALSAALYFGKICVGDFQWKHTTPEGKEYNKIGAVFHDGGQGTQNSPVLAAMIEAICRWKDEDINILSIGCGDQDEYIDYNKAKKTTFVRQILNFLGQARSESGIIQHIGAEYLDKSWNNFSYRRINATINSKQDALDGKKYINDYIAIGKRLAATY